MLHPPAYPPHLARLDPIISAVCTLLNCLAMALVITSRRVIARVSRRTRRLIFSRARHYPNQPSSLSESRMREEDERIYLECENLKYTNIFNDADCRCVQCSQDTNSHRRVGRNCSSARKTILAIPE
jgi:hypothetical protein